MVCAPPSVCVRLSARGPQASSLNVFRTYYSATWVSVGSNVWAQSQKMKSQLQHKSAASAWRSGWKGVDLINGFQMCIDFFFWQKRNCFLLPLLFLLFSPKTILWAEFWFCLELQILASMFYPYCNLSCNEGWGWIQSRLRALLESI